VEKRTPSSVIKAEGLVKRYGDRVALNGVSFSVREGEIFGLLGPNGAGKTTLISILATLLPLDEGQVLICGYDLRREADRIRPLIGFVPQELALYPTLSAWDNLASSAASTACGEQPSRNASPPCWTWWGCAIAPGTPCAPSPAG